MNKPTPTQKLKDDLETSQRLNERLRQQNDNLEGRDAFLRERFTAVLNSPQRRSGDYWSQQSEKKTLSWEEIFFQIGSGFARLFNHDVKDEIDGLRNELYELQKKVDPQ